MASADPFRDAETSMRTLLEESGLPQPDEVEFREASIALLWHDPKLVVIVDEIPAPPP